MTPHATLRLQFHKGFTFGDAESLVPYFAALGVSHLYASPITTARPGSLHGYDVIDPTRVNPELGGEDGLRSLVEALRRKDLGLIVDIVPNHMAAVVENGWWADVLRHGRDSRYARSFDIDWEGEDPELQNKLFLPVLGRPLQEALERGDAGVKLGRETAGDDFPASRDFLRPEIGRATAEGCPRRRKGGLAMRLVLQRADLIHEVVAGRAVTAPVGRQRFAAHQDLFDHEIRSRRHRGIETPAQLTTVACGIVQPVDVVDAHAVDQALGI